MKKFSIISSLSLLALLAGCGSCNKKRTCTPEACTEEKCEVAQCQKSCEPCKEEVCEVAHVAPQSQRVSGPHSDANVKWEKEDFA